MKHLIVILAWSAQPERLVEVLSKVMHFINKLLLDCEHDSMRLSLFDRQCQKKEHQPNEESAENKCYDQTSSTNDSADQL